ncbi:HAD-IIIA family hydrolase [Phascolarctobacterium sp.]|uniref:KdsC family phosphatase n=1 Tax=Phascolarctobacterium sp. TaxID=2049039 RepID=UPI002A828F79|nr:HAD-IIIA family hydrolase [Phascolarctobacterium sp.]MDY5044656.1 HAD-IIIA family hydrolase [Phascolarctobacterium sp.]
MSGNDEKVLALGNFKVNVQYKTKQELSAETLTASLQKIKLLALDVDGVLTDGTIYISPAGEVFKGFNAKDGMGISCALRNNLQIAVITGRQSPIVERRCEELGIKLFMQGVKDKRLALQQMVQKLGLTREEIAYMGDDLNDIPAFKASGLNFVPADGSIEVLAVADIITKAKGGRGAVREAITMILAAQDNWEQIVNSYLTAGQGDKQ